MKIIKILETSFFKARKYLLAEGLNETQIVRKNSSSDISRLFDIKTEEILVNELSNEFPDFSIISEEIGEISKTKSSKFFIIDPVDGSFNFLKQIGGAGCSIALFDGKSKDLRNVIYGFVGNYITGEIFFARKDSGVFLNYKKISCSKITDISNSIIGIDFDYINPSDRSHLFNIIKIPKAIRYIGSASIDLCNVARGAYDVYIDYRNDLTPENFCAAQLIIKEAGGIFTDEFGKEITNFSMTSRFSIIACSTIELKNNILKMLV